MPGTEVRSHHKKRWHKLVANFAFVLDPPTHTFIGVTFLNVFLSNGLNRKERVYFNIIALEYKIKIYLQCWWKYAGRQGSGKSCAAGRNVVPIGGDRDPRVF
jgi:hypothetical protein